jgi:ankyrin repeat protein
MHGFGKFTWSMVAATVSLAGFSSCRKPAEAVKSDLSEAGYQLTTADWIRASRTNDASAMKKFIAGGFSPDSRDETGDSALHAAAAAGAKDSADFLLDRGMSVDLTGAAGRTPLMAAVLGDQSMMVRWLLRQGADARLKDGEGFAALMIAVREGKAGPVEELAPYHREGLDSALLLAALLGRTEVIDTLTNYGASVYARMEDGRTPLMIAAENGHTASVELLLDIGASRLATDADGRSAADLATTAGHAEIAQLILREPSPEELSIESPAEIAKTMDAYVEAAGTGVTTSVDSPETSPASSPTAHEESGSPQLPRKPSPAPAKPIQGEVLSVAVAKASPTADAASPAPAVAPEELFAMPPLVMRHYRERDIPLQVRSVDGETATFAFPGSTRADVKITSGKNIPGTNLVVVRAQRRMEDSKVNLGQPAEISVVEVRDGKTGTTREWISGVPSKAHDPVALVEDAATGQRYTATPGQRFTSADGVEYIISDVRPNQLIIQDAASGAARTIPLRGPRG